MKNQLSQIIKSSFDPYFEAPIEIWEPFAEKGNMIETKKNEVLKKYGEREKYLYFEHLLSR
ncbi:MAG: hypothetical protein EAZ80_04420 [Runella slithyformis]|nr:MAG: hypothetical protein EAZ80_04420 [Runella slithyformis]